LFALTCALFAILGILELVRSRLLVRIGGEIDGRLSNRVFMAALRQSLLKKGHSGGPLRELDTVRQFLSGPGPLTFFDAPWTPIYLLVVFMFHWILGVAGLIGAGLLVIIAIASEFRSRKPLGEAAQALNVSMDMAETGQRNVEVLQAMGMSQAYRTRWQTANHAAMNWQTLAADRLGSMGALSKSLRLLLQSAMLGLGAALALQNEISAGTIVAATIIFGRSLAPVEMAINQWRSFVRARMAYHKLNELLRALPEPEERTSLPAPAGHLEVEGLRVAAPMSRQMVLNGLSFAVPAGKVLCVVGPSASGKSTLARTLVGLWQPLAGAVRLDGAKLQHWNLAELGHYLGYLPQDVELFAGTVRENIARFQADAKDDDIISAARMAHAHDLILALPQGYETELGPFGAHLSAGQRQRVALARALYGKPALVVLDEPNSNLDRAGDEALARAVAGMRERGQTVVIVSHRVQAVRLADLMLYIDGGTQKAFGPREDVLRQLQPQAQTQTGQHAEPRSGVSARAPGSGAPTTDRRSVRSAHSG
jgi:ATP-binding cassette subfamily C protein